MNELRTCEKINWAWYKTIFGYDVEIGTWFFKIKKHQSNLLDHAKRELDFAGYTERSDDPADKNGHGMNQMMRENVLELIEAFSKQGHSGMSAEFALQIFDDLAHYRTITPLTGAANEWTNVSDARNSEVLYQNKRMSNIFKDASGASYNINGYIFKEKNGNCFTGKGSIKYITFPYTHQEPIYIAVNDEGVPILEMDRKMTGRGEIFI